MKVLIPLAALFCASTVSAAPAFGQVSEIVKRSASISAISNLNQRTDIKSSRSDNPLHGIVDGLLAGGDVGTGISSCMGNANFADHAIEVIADADFIVKFGKLCTNAEFLGKVGGLLTNEAFLDSCSGIVAGGNFGTQLGHLFANVDFIAKLSAGLSNADFIAGVGAQLGANFDFGAKFSALLRLGSFNKLFIKLCGQGTIGAKFGLLLGDSTFITKFSALLTVKANFGAQLGALLADKSFTSHVCGVLGLNTALTAKITVLFGANVNFGAKLEAILGSAFSGKITGVLGSGSCTKLLTGFFGSNSFNDSCRNAFSGGLIFKAFAKLVAEGDFAVKFCGFFSSLLSGSITLVVLIGNIFADVAFTASFCGLFGITATISNLLCVVFGGEGLLNFVNCFLSGTVQAVGGIVSSVLGLLGLHKRVVPAFA